MRRFLCFLEIGLFTLYVPFIARLCSFERILQIVEPRKRWPRDGVLSVAEVTAFVDRILRYRLFMRKQLCFRRGLVLYRFLHKLGVPVRINFSVQPPEQGHRLKAHAWLSLDGKPYLEAGETHAEFKLIFSHDGTSSKA